MSEKSVPTSGKFISIPHRFSPLLFLFYGWFPSLKIGSSRIKQALRLPLKAEGRKKKCVYNIINFTTWHHFQVLQGIILTSCEEVSEFVPSSRHFRRLLEKPRHSFERATFRITFRKSSHESRVQLNYETPGLKEVCYQDLVGLGFKRVKIIS